MFNTKDKENFPNFDIYLKKSEVLDNVNFYKDELLREEDDYIRDMYAPFIIMNADISITDLKIPSNPMEMTYHDFIMINCILYRIIKDNSNHSVKDVRGLLQNVRKSLTSGLFSKKEIPKRLNHTLLFIDECLNKINEHTYKEHIFLTKSLNIDFESALTNYSPIVGYQKPFLKAPGYTRKKKYTSVSIQEATDKPIFNGLTEYYGVKTGNPLEFLMSGIEPEALKNIYTSIVVDSNPMLLMKTNDLVVDSTDKLIKLASDITSGICDPFAFYYVIVYKYYHEHEIANSAIHSAIKSAIDLLKNENVSMDLIVESFVNAGIYNDLTDSELEERMKINPDYERDTKIFNSLQLAGVSIDDDPNFNIDIILNYIYTNRQYKTDEYTNQLFCQGNPNIENRSFFTNNIMIAQLGDEYLISPVIDILDNWKSKLILLDREGNITVKDTMILV